MSHQLQELPSPYARTAEKQIESSKIIQPQGSKERKSTLSSKEGVALKSVIVEEGVICRDVYNKRPLVVGDEFGGSVGKLYCFTKISSAHSPTKITHVWYFGDTAKARVNLRINSSAWRTHSSKKIRAYEVGDWHVDVLGPSGELLRTLRFRITPKEEKVSSAVLRLCPYAVALHNA